MCPDFRTLRHCLRALAALVMLAAFAGQSAAREGKLDGVALVIGQSAYEHIAALPNPANDARDLAKLLADLGFDVRTVTDRDAARLRRDLDRFVEDAGEADVALVYYSGHGIEAGGENFLLPVDADLDALDEAGERLMPLSRLLDALKARVPVTIVLLDACRTNPFPEGTAIRMAPGAKPLQVGAGGLTAMRGATALASGKPAGRDNLGMVIGFAAEPGLPALDGEAGANSPYAAALLRHLAALPGIEFGAVMRMVTEEVYLATATQQRPWVNESLRRLLYFGMAPQQPDGVDKTILGERRQLLLTIAELPGVERVEVEQVALREGVKLDALYGVLRALGTKERPDDPQQLQDLLEGQAARIRHMLDQRAALQADDPEIAALSAAADRAIGEGAVEAARGFLDQAVARVEADAAALDVLEEELKARRIADAAVYARRADASALAFAFRAASDDYGKAFELVEKWDERLAWNYLNLRAEALQALGRATADRAVLDEALSVYRSLLDMLPHDARNAEWARTRNNMAVVLNTIGEREESSHNLRLAREMFAEAMEVFAAVDDEASWAAAQNNVGNIMMALGMRAGDSALLVDAVAAYRAALARRDRAAVPLDWAATQNNIGIALFSLAEQRPDLAELAEAEAAYRAALEVLTPARNPLDWSMVQNNLGNTLNAMGLQRHDPALLAQAVEAYEAALTVRVRERFPLQYAATQLNLGNAFGNLARHESGTASLDSAKAAYAEALAVFTREQTPLDWASAQNNLGTTLQTIGQRLNDIELLRRSVDAFDAAARVYVRSDFPLDWAMTRNNLGNSLQLMALISGDAGFHRQAAGAYREALAEYTRGRTPMQWATAAAGLGNALQGLSNSEPDTGSLVEAIAMRRAALEVLTADNAPIDWANAQNGLGTSLLNLANRERDSSHLADAAAAFEAATKVFTRDAQPLQWAFAQNNIGDVHWSMAALGGGEEKYRQALARFETARETFAGIGYQPLVDLVDQKIALIRDKLPQGK